MSKAIKVFALIGLAAFIFLLLISLGAGQEVTNSIIPTAPPVTMSQCSPCHNNLDAFKNPKLVFNHSVHFERGIKCQSCHLEFPHQPGKITKPTMERCFICHGVSHGVQGLLAPKNCDACHPRGFNLVPTSHTPQWVTALHKDEDPKNLGTCLMCHQRDECSSCHSIKNVKPVRFEILAPLVPLPKPRPIIFIDLAPPVTMSKCSPCHLNLDAFKNPGLTFNHPVHLEKGIRCLACHQEYPHQPSQTIKPDMRICATCHGLTHARQGKIAPMIVPPLPLPEGCQLVCHPKGFKTLPATHEALEEWRTKLHPIVAKQDISLCLTCHTEDFCSARCHSPRKIKPASHDDPEWRSVHGKRPPPELPGCRICHTEPATLTCTSCHAVHASEAELIQPQYEADAYGPYNFITEFTRLYTQLIRKDPAGDGTGNLAVSWRTDPNPEDGGGDGIIVQPGTGASLSQLDEVRWYTFFCADCHSAAHAAAGATNTGGDTTTVGHRWDLEPYIGSADANEGLLIPGGTTGTRTDGYIEDNDTWNQNDDAPTCRQCHSARVYRPPAAAYSSQGADKRRPRYPHLGVLGDQLLRDNSNGELNTLTQVRSKSYGGPSANETPANRRFAGINNLTAMTSATWPLTFSADGAGTGRERITNVNNVCLSCHNTLTLP